MLIWLSLRWWYGDGWEWAIKRAIVERLQWCNETFSVAGLIRTWFAPFKQSYSRSKGSSIDMKLHVMLDNVISRFVGFFARTFIILAGLVAAVFVLITGLMFVVLWPLAPLAIPASIAMIIFGVGK